ncbi:hypothetical protein [Spirosoma arcticum]
MSIFSQPRSFRIRYHRDSWAKYCVGVGELTADLTVTVLGNPAGETATVEIAGAEQQALVLRSRNFNRCRLVEQRTIERAKATERQTFDLRQQAAGALLLRTTTNGQSQTVKLLQSY